MKGVNVDENYKREIRTFLIVAFLVFVWLVSTVLIINMREWHTDDTRREIIDACLDHNVAIEQCYVPRR